MPPAPAGPTPVPHVVGTNPTDPPIPTAPATSVETAQVAAEAALTRASAVIAIMVIVAGYALALAIAATRRRAAPPQDD